MRGPPDDDVYGQTAHGSYTRSSASPGGGGNDGRPKQEQQHRGDSTREPMMATGTSAANAQVRMKVCELGCVQGRVCARHVALSDGFLGEPWKATGPMDGSASLAEANGERKMRAATVMSRRTASDGPGETRSAAQRSGPAYGGDGACSGGGHGRGASRGLRCTALSALSGRAVVPACVRPAARDRSMVRRTMRAGMRPSRGDGGDETFDAEQLNIDGYDRRDQPPPRLA